MDKTKGGNETSGQDRQHSSGYDAVDHREFQPQPGQQSFQDCRSNIRVVRMGKRLQHNIAFVLEISHQIPSPERKGDDVIPVMEMLSYIQGKDRRSGSARFVTDDQDRLF